MILLFRTSLAVFLALFLATGCEERNETAEQPVDETGAVTDMDTETGTEMETEPDSYTMGEDPGAVTTEDTTDTMETTDTAGMIDEEQLNELQQMSYDERQQFTDQVRQARDSMQQSTAPLSTEAQQAMQQIDANLDRLTNASAEEFEQLKSETLAHLRTVHTEVQAH